MFRNAEYVLALKDIMDIQAMPSVSELKLAFEKIDSDNSGYIEASEVEALLQEVYKNNDPDKNAEPAAVPRFEIQTFLSFFDANRDGRISNPSSRPCMKCAPICPASVFIFSQWNSAVPIGPCTTRPLRSPPGP